VVLQILPSTSPLVVLNYSDRFSFQLRIDSLLDLAVEAVHVNENNDSFGHDGIINLRIQIKRFLNESSKLAANVVILTD
jgi:hypothetical protein